MYRKKVQKLLKSTLKKKKMSVSDFVHIYKCGGKRKISESTILRLKNNNTGKIIITTLIDIEDFCLNIDKEIYLYNKLRNESLK